MRSILFVDFDGVFHAMTDCNLEYCGSALVVSDNPNLFQWAPLLWDVIEPYPIELVQHSPWRHLAVLDDSQVRRFVAG